MRIFGFILLAAIVVVGLFLLFKKKKEKSACAKVLDVGEKGVDAYYHTKTSSIVDDKKDDQLCKLAAAVAGGGAKGTAQFLSSHTTIKTALLGATAPANIASQIKDGNVSGAIGTAANTLTGANVLNSLGDQIDNWPCAKLKTECAKEKRTGTGADGLLNSIGSGPICRTFGKKKCT